MAVELRYKSFLLRPSPQAEPRTLEAFRQYTESWRRPAEEEPAATFQVWQSDEGPPTHSVPPHLVAKAAEQLDAACYERLHWSLLEAYFCHNRDITAEHVLLELWLEAGLPEADFRARLREELAQEIVDDHTEAMQNGASGVPAVRTASGFGVVMGAQPVEAYHAWINKLVQA